MEPVTISIAIAALIKASLVGTGTRDIQQRVMWNDRRREPAKHVVDVALGYKKRKKSRPVYMYLRPFQKDKKDGKELEIGIDNCISDLEQARPAIEAGVSSQYSYISLSKYYKRQEPYFVGLSQNRIFAHYDVEGAIKLGEFGPEWEEWVKRFANIAKILFCVPSTSEGTSIEMKIINDHNFQKRTFFILTNGASASDQIEALGNFGFTVPKKVRKRCLSRSHNRNEPVAVLRYDHQNEISRKFLCDGDFKSTIFKVLLEHG